MRLHGVPIPKHREGPGTSAPELRLSWARATDGRPNRLCDVLSDPTPVRGLNGVYVIWDPVGGGEAPRWIYVGDGADVGARLECHRCDPRILVHDTGAKLGVSWAAVASMYLPGVLCYLSQRLSPLVSNPLPVARLVPVNLPAA